MELRRSIVALCALQALTALAVQPTSGLSRYPSTGESSNTNLQKNSPAKYLQIIDDSLKSQVAALQETLEDIAECWGQRRRRRRRRPRPPPTAPPEGDGDGDDAGGDGDARRRRREAPPPQRQMHFFGTGNNPASGQGAMSFGGGHGTSAGMGMMEHTFGTFPKMIGQGLNAATEMFGGKAGGGGFNLGMVLGGNLGASAPGGFGGNNWIPGTGGFGRRGIKGPGTGMGELGRPRMGEPGRPGMGEPGRPGMGEPGRPGMGGPGGLGMGGGEGSFMQGTGFYGRIPGIASQMFGGNGGSGGFNSVGGRPPGMGGQNGANMGGSGRHEMGGEGGSQMQGDGMGFSGRIPGSGSGFPGMGGRGERRVEGEVDSVGSMSSSGSFESMGDMHGGQGMASRNGGRGMVNRQGDSVTQSGMQGHNFGRGYYQGQASMNFGLGGMDSWPDRGTANGGGGRADMGRNPTNMGRPQRGEGDMVPRGPVLPASMEARGSAETTARGRKTFSQNGSTNMASGSNGNVQGSLRSQGRPGRGNTTRNIYNTLRSNRPSGPLNGRSRFDATGITESQEAGRLREGSRDRRREDSNGRSGREVTDTTTTPPSDNMQLRVNRAGGTERGRNRGRSRDGSRRRGNDPLERQATASSWSSSSSSMGPNGKGRYSFSSISESSDGRRTFNSGGGVIGRAPSVNTVRKTRAKRQVDIGTVVSGVALAAQAALAIAGQTLGLVKQGIGVAGLAANTTIDVYERIRPLAPQRTNRRIIVRVYQTRPRRRG